MLEKRLSLTSHTLPDLECGRRNAHDNLPAMAEARKTISKTSTKYKHWASQLRRAPVENIFSPRTTFLYTPQCYEGKKSELLVVIHENLMVSNVFGYHKWNQRVFPRMTAS